MIYKDTIIFGIYGPAYAVSLPLGTCDHVTDYREGRRLHWYLVLEEFAAANPLYPCCSFAGSMAASDATTGGIIL